MLIGGIHNCGTVGSPASEILHLRSEILWLEDSRITKKSQMDGKGDHGEYIGCRQGHTKYIQLQSCMTQYTRFGNPCRPVRPPRNSAADSAILGRENKSRHGLCTAKKRQLESIPHSDNNQRGFKKMSFVIEFLRRQFTALPPLPPVSLIGQNVIVTGANTGLGYETALGLAKLNPARLICACRDVERGNAAVQRIRQSSGVSDETSVEMWLLDLADFNSVKAFAERVEKELKTVNIVVENAGVSTLKWSITKDGWEKTLQVNVLATFLLAILLLPILRRTAKTAEKVPRLVIVASEAQYFASFAERSADNIFDALNDEKNARMLDRYAVSKLLDVFLTRELANYVEDIEICSVHPGLCYSDLNRELRGNPILDFFLGVFMKAFARTTEQGATNFIHAAVSDDVKGRGEFLSDFRVREPVKMVASPEGNKLQKKLWDELIQIYKNAGFDCGHL